MSERAAPTNCQQEPSYPGAETVVCSLRYPEMVVHLPTTRCGIQEPHAWSACTEVHRDSLAWRKREVMDLVHAFAAEAIDAGRYGQFCDAASRPCGATFWAEYDAEAESEIGIPGTDATGGA